MRSDREQQAISAVAALEAHGPALAKLELSVPPTAGSTARHASRDAASAIRTISSEQRGLDELCKALGGHLGESFSSAVGILAAVTGRVIVSGVGKSGHIARKIAATFASTGRPAHFVHPSDASHGDLGMIRTEDAVLALSWSGESAELADLIVYTRRFGVPLIASTSQAQSSLARAADVLLLLPEIAEACPDSLAPTTSTTMQLALGDALALALLDRNGFTARDFRELHPGGRLGARLQRVTDLMHKVDEVPLIPSDATLAQAIMRMTSGRFGITGVVDGAGLLIGVVTDGDLRRAFAAGFHDRPALEVMGRHPRTIAPGDLASAALAHMQRDSITSLFVVEDSRAIGILHIHDLLRAGVL